MQRTGYEDKPGLIYVLNNRGDIWNGTMVNTRWPNTRFVPVAWWGKDDRSRPYEQQTGPAGNGEFYAAPRGFAVYAPM
jgi:alpha-amylase